MYHLNLKDIFRALNLICIIDEWAWPISATQEVINSQYVVHLGY